MTLNRDEALKVIFENIKDNFYEVVTLEDANDRILYEDIKAKFDIPETNKSAMDGIAFNIDNITSFPVTLKLKATLRAGSEPIKEVKDEAIFLMTGAVVPDDANCIVRIEDVEINDNEVTIFNAKRGDLINFAGEEMKKGEIILKKGQKLDYKKIALLANMGYYQIKVFKKLKVGIVVTGDEVKEPFEDTNKAGVKNSNIYILRGLLKDYADINYYGNVNDDIEALRDIFDIALRENDILISSGGASKGKYDFTKDVAKEVGIDIKFTHTNIRPGRPMVFGVRKDKLFFGLPGYPSALLVNSIVYLMSFIKKLYGIREKKVFAITKEILKGRKKRFDYIRVNTFYENGKIYIKNSGIQQTSIFTTMAFADALAIIDEDKDIINEGEVVEIIYI